MEYRCTYNADQDLVEAVTGGVASPAEFSDMLIEVAGLCRRNETAHILIDHTALDVGNLRMEEIRALSRLVASARDLIRERKCAHLVGSDLQFGLVRAWEIMVEINGFPELTTRVFRDRLAALDWLHTG